MCDLQLIFSNLILQIMGFRHFTSIFNEISALRQSNLLVNTKLVFSDGSLLVHLHMLEAGGLWWTKCRDLEIPPDEIVYLFLYDSFGLEMMHELYRDCENIEKFLSV